MGGLCAFCYKNEHLQSRMSALVILLQWQRTRDSTGCLAIRAVKESVWRPWARRWQVRLWADPACAHGHRPWICSSWLPGFLCPSCAKGLCLLWSQSTPSQPRCLSAFLTQSRFPKFMPPSSSVWLVKFTFSHQVTSLVTACPGQVPNSGPISYDWGRGCGPQDVTWLSR